MIKIWKNWATSAIQWIEKHDNLLLAIMMCVQSFVFTVLLIMVGPVIEPDTSSYVLPAESLLQVGRLLENGEPTMIRTPGYPIFLACIYALLGKSNLAVAVVQAVLCVLSTWMIHKGVNLLTEGRYRICSLLSALFFVLDPCTYTYGISVLSDMPHGVAILASAFFWILYIKKEKTIYGVLSVLSLCFALSLRPISMYLCLILAVLAIVLVLLKKMPKGLACFAVCAILVTYCGWCARTLYYHDMFVYSPIRSHNLMYYDGAATRMLVENINREEARALMETDLLHAYPNYEALGTMEQFAAQGRIGSAYIKEHVGAYLIVNLNGLYDMMIGSGIYEFPILALRNKIVSYCVSGCLVLSYLFYAYGFLSNIKRQKAIDWLILLSVMYFMAASASVGYGRFRVAYYPIMLIGAGACWRNRKMKA